MDGSLSQFMFAVPVAGIIGGPLSGWTMSSMDGALGLAGWQWLFLIEGLPTSILGIACYFLLTDTPPQASWLTAREKKIVEAALASDRSDPTPSHASLGAELRRAFGDVRVWILSCVYFTSACAVYTFTFWLPTMIRNLGVTDFAKIGFYSFFPYVFAALGILAVGWSSDRQRERRWHVAGPMIIAALALSLTTMLESSLFLSLAVLCVVGFFNFGASVLYLGNSSDLPEQRRCRGRDRGDQLLGRDRRFSEPDTSRRHKDIYRQLECGHLLRIRSPGRGRLGDFNGLAVSRTSRRRICLECRSTRGAILMNLNSEQATWFTPGQDGVLLARSPAVVGLSNPS